MSMKFVRRAALAAPLALSLTGCLGFGAVDNVAPHMKQLPAAAQALLATKGMTEDAPIFIRIFKEESELEIWKLKDGRFEHFKTYPICAWSGELGPKVVEGDKQAPEGFYTVSAGMMNPKSQFHLSFNLGYPNAFDKANARTGSALMVHGDCRSAGCFAMTDALIEEIYILAREAFEGGQTKFHVHAFPFRMTEENLQRHRASKWYPFWRSLKEGYDAFEISRKPPLIRVCSRQYLVNVEFMGHVAEPDPSGPCPTYAKIDPDKLPGIDGVPQTMLASLKKPASEGQQTEGQPVALAANSAPAALANAEPVRPVHVAASAPSAAEPETASPQRGAMSASQVVRAPAASAAMMASFSPPQPSAPLAQAGFIATPAEAAPSAAVAIDAPAEAVPPPAEPIVAQPGPAGPAPAAPVQMAEPAPSRYVAPDALQKPNRSGKGGKLSADSEPAPGSIAVGFSSQGGGLAVQ